MAVKLLQYGKNSFRMGMAALALAYITLTPYTVNAENKLQEVWAKAYHYEGSLLWFKGLATLEIILGNEKYKSRLIVREEEEAFPRYSMSVEGRILENRLYPNKFIIKKGKDDSTIINFKYFGELLNEIDVNGNRVSEAELEDRVVVDYLTAALQVMYNLRHGIKGTREIFTISKRGNISNTNLQLDGKSVSVPINKKKVIRALELMLDSEYEPAGIKLNIVWKIFSFNVDLDLMDVQAISPN